MEFLSKVGRVFAERWDWLLTLLIQHLLLSLTAIVIAIILGVILGMWIAEKDRYATPVLAVANVLYTIPSIALLGMLIPIAGIGNKTAIIALILYGIMPVIRNTYTGIRNVDKGVIDAAFSMGFNTLQVLLYIKLPIALNVIVAGIRNVVVMTISVAAIASFIGAGGLGVSIYRGITLYNPALTFVGSFLIALLALISDWLLGKWERSLKERYE